jgi:ASC-1-like (ASCH) protein
MNEPVLDLECETPFFEQIKNGKKKIEGRLGKAKYLNLQPNDCIRFNNSLCTKVQAVRHYPSFVAMLQKEGIEHVLPGIRTVREGANIYKRFYTADEEKTYGAVAIEVVLTY